MNAFIFLFLFPAHETGTRVQFMNTVITPLTVIDANHCWMA